MEAQRSDQTKNLQILFNALGEEANRGKNFNELLDSRVRTDSGVIHLDEKLEMNREFGPLDDMVSETPITLDDIEQILGMSGGSSLQTALDLGSSLQTALDLGSSLQTALDLAPRSHSNSDSQSFYATSPESGISGCHDRSPMNGVLGSPGGIADCNTTNQMEAMAEYNANNQMNNINNDIPIDLDMSDLLDFPIQNMSGPSNRGLLMIPNNQGPLSGSTIPRNETSHPSNEAPISINQGTIPINQVSIANNQIFIPHHQASMSMPPSQNPPPINRGFVPTTDNKNHQVSVNQNSIMLLNGDPYLSQAMAPTAQFHSQRSPNMQQKHSFSSHPSTTSFTSHPAPNSFTSHPTPHSQHTLSLSSQTSSQSLPSRTSSQSQYTLSFPSQSNPIQHTMSLSPPQSNNTFSHPGSQYLLTQNVTNFTTDASAPHTVETRDIDDDIREVPFVNKVDQVPVVIKEEFSPENAGSMIHQFSPENTRQFSPESRGSVMRQFSPDNTSSTGSMISHSLAGAMSLVRPKEDEDKSDPTIPATVQGLEKDVEMKKEVDDGENICEVCREAAGKHSYYGGKVCPSCRAFFRRSVQSKYYEIFFCKKEENCTVTIKTRKNCQFCRFKKCLEAGMRTTWVLSDEERNRRFNKFHKMTNKPLKDRTTKSLNPKDRYLRPPRQQTSLIHDPYMPFTSEEQKTLEGIQEKFKVCKMGWLTNLLIYNFEAGLDVINVAFNGGQMKFASYMSMAKSWEILFVQKMIYAVEDELRHLPQIEQAVFLNGQNSTMAHNLKAAACLLREERCIIDQQTIEAARVQIAQQDEELADRLGQLSLNGTPQYPSYKSVFFDRWANNSSMEQKHLELTQKIKNWPEVDKKLDLNLLVLIMMVVLFNPDSFEATVHKSCEKIQLRYTLMLQRYLQTRMPSASANNKFVEGLLLISYSKEITDIAKAHVELRQY